MWLVGARLGNWCVWLCWCVCDRHVVGSGFIEHWLGSVEGRNNARIILSVAATVKRKDDDPRTHSHVSTLPADKVTTLNSP